LEKSGVPLGLVEQMWKGNCVLFLGTQHWPDPNGEEAITAELLRHCEYDGKAESFSEASQAYEMAHGRQSLIERVSSWIEGHAAIETRLERCIVRLPFNAIITTRIDSLLEESAREEKRIFQRIIKDEDLPFLDSQKLAIVKIHGGVEHKEALVLTERDQLSLFKRRPLLSEHVRMFFATKTVLFVSHDLDHAYSKILHREIIEEIGGLTRRAYALVSGASTYARNYWKRENVEIIDLDPVPVLELIERERSSASSTREKVPKEEATRRPKYPYKFLDHFDTEDADLFFGRAHESKLLATKIQTHRLFVLFGDSGVGKTSLVKAGIMPELLEAGIFPIYTRALGSALIEIESAVYVALKNEIPSYAMRSEGGKLADHLLLCQQRLGKAIVLFVDQLEELFSLPRGRQDELIEELSDCIKDRRLELRLVLSLRSEYLSELDAFREFLPTVLSNVFRLYNLSDSSAVDAIVRPLESFGAKFEDEVVRLLIRDLRSEGSVSPAQLQIVCDKLYEQYSPNGIITVEDYRRAGETRKILADYLEEALLKLAWSARTLAKQVLQALVTIGKKKKLLSRQDLERQLKVTWSQLEEVVVGLERFRLIRRIDSHEGTRYEVVHEYIVEQIWRWLSEADVKVKEVQEMIDIEVRRWREYDAPLSGGKLDAIYACWNLLILEEKHWELLFCSSINFGYLKQWNEVAVTLPESGVPFFLRCLQDENRNVVRMAVIALTQLQASERMQSALSQLGETPKYIARTALQHLKEGRAIDDFQTEKADRDWKKKSVWNTAHAVGIDFGTTTSAIAVLRNDKPILIPNREGSKFTPSVVTIAKNGEIAVGMPAVMQAATHPDRTVASVKRHLGTNWKMAIDGVTYTAVDITAMILRSLKQEAEIYLQRKITQAVIGMPVYFNNNQICALRDAAKMAGFEVLRMIVEPTAACLAYGFSNHYEQDVAVYDLGGGTFDISILEIGDGVYEVKAVNGDTKLGGDDFDDRIVRFLVKEFRKQYAIDLSSDKGAMVRLKEAAERAKIALSGLNTVNIYIPYVHADKGGIKHLDYDLTRATFEELTGDLLEKTIVCCRKALKDSGQSPEKLEVIMVGLSTKIPALRSAVSKIFQKEPQRGVDPDEAVALGLALQAGVLKGDVKDVLLLDVTPLSLGIESLGGVFTKLIERNTTIPTRHSETFSTASDKQTEIEVHVLQGERQFAKDNISIGKFKLTEIPPAPRGVPQIEVTFDIDTNGILYVGAKDLATGREEKLTITFWNEIQGTTGNESVAENKVPILAEEKRNLENKKMR
jgi:molecular chaperone DnaK